jgi:hypothetical protein
VNVAGVVRGRLRLARNTLFRRGRATEAQARHPHLGLAIALALGALLFSLMRATFRLVAENGAGAGEAAGLLGLLLAAGLAGMLVFDLQEAMGVLLLDSDLELLRRAPLAPREVFALKLADALARTSTLVAVFLLPALLAYAAVYLLPAWGWVVMLVGLACLWAIPLGFGVALTLLLISRLPVRLAREGLAQLSTLALLLMWFANAFLLPRLARSDEPLPDLIARLMSAPGRLGSLLPSAWAAQALAAAVRHDPGAAARGTLALVLAGALAMALATWVAARQLENAQARVAAPVGRKRARSLGVRPVTANTAAAPARAGRAPSAWSAILRRDARLFFRDWTVLGDVLVSAALWTVFPLVSIARAPSTSGLTVLAMLVTLAVALGHEVAARTLPFERSGGAWRQLAPVAPARWASAKLAGAAAIAVPILLVASVTLALVFRLPIIEWLRVLGLGLPALAVALSLGLLSGATFGNPRWTDPRAMLGVAGRLVALLLLAGQIAFWAAIWFLGRGLGTALPAGAELYGPIAIGTPIAVVLFHLAVRRLARMEWPG